MAALSMSLSLSSTRPGIKPARLTRATTRGRARVMTVSAVARARQAPAIKADAPPPATGTTTTPAGDAEGGYFGSGFEAPNEYGYFTSAIGVAEQKRQDKLEAGGFKQIKGLTAEEEKARYAKLCAKHPESQRCAEGFSQQIRHKAGDDVVDQRQRGQVRRHHTHPGEPRGSHHVRTGSQDERRHNRTLDPR